jgi:hypothetical protein
LRAWWRLDGGTLHCLANLGESAMPSDPLPGTAIWYAFGGGVLPAWLVAWTWEG